MIFIITFILSLPTWAQEAGDYTVEMLDRIEAFNNPRRNKCLSPQEYTKAPYCGRDHASFLNNENNQLSFTNDGKSTKEKNGLFNMGFCWWHSRMTLNAAYVAEFDAEDGIEVKNEKVAVKIIEKIRQGQHVKIKNFKNLKTFSEKYKKAFKRELNQWMLSDTLKFKWTNALKDPAKITNAELTQKLDELKKQIDLNGPRFISTQYSGVFNGSHSMIITGIEKETVKIKNVVIDKTVDQDVFRLTVVDSNKTHTQSILFLPNTKQTTLSLAYYDADEMKNLDPEVYSTYVRNVHYDVQYSKIAIFKDPFVPVDFNYVDREKERLLKTYKETCK